MIKLLIFKYILSAGMIVLISEIAKRLDRVGALISSLPLVSVLVMIWMFHEKQGTDKIANHAYYTFWYVIPTLPMFLLMPFMLHRGFHFYSALGASIALTFVCFLLFALFLKKFGIGLM